MGTKTARIDKWDNYKLILIILVVIGHLMKEHQDYSRTARTIYWWIYLFHMPAFIMASGMFAKRSIRERRYEKVFMFLILYFMIKFMIFLTRVLLGERISMTLFSASGVEWYAFALGVFYLLTMFLQKFDRRHIFLLALVLGCAAGYDKSIGDEYVLARIITFYPFFLLGFYLESEQVMAFTGKKLFKTAAVLALVIALLVGLFYIDKVYWSIDLIKGNTSYKIFAKDVRAYAVFYRLGQYLVAGLLVFSVFALVPSRKLAFSYIGRQTLPIYALHYIVIELFYTLFNGTALIQSISSRYYEFLLIPIGILMVLILSLKPFVALVNRIIAVKPAAENTEPKKS